MSGTEESIELWTDDLVRDAHPGHLSGAPAADGSQPDALPVPDVDIVAFADDSVLSGRIRLAADRVSDTLNASRQFWVTNGLLEDLSDGHALEVPGLLLRRDEIVVVQADGPRGNIARRRRMCQFPLLAKAGPYEVFGYVHVLPGAPPIPNLRRHDPMIAMTDAVIGFSIGSKPYLRRASVVMLNQERIDWIVEAPDDGLVFRMPAEPAGRLAKDLTGYLHI